LVALAVTFELAPGASRGQIPPMHRYLISRFLQSLLLLWLSTLAVFTLVHLMPGGVLAAFANNPLLTPQTKQAIIHDLGLDQPLPTQYLRWLWAVLHGNFGDSYHSGQPVMELIAEHLPPTLELSAAGFLIAVLAAFLVGIYSALRRYSLLDYALTFLAYAGISIPIFWLGVMLILVFAVIWPIFPVQGFNSLIHPSLLSNLHHLILPAITLSTFFIAVWSRYIRSSLIETLSQDYVRTARAKGLPERRVLFRHVLRNALMPFVTVFALDLGAVVGGATVTETVFAWPGMGQLFYNSLTYRDYPVIMAILLLAAASVILANFLADLVYGLLDPRIQLG